MLRFCVGMRHLLQVFVQFGIPHRLIGAVRFFERAEIKDLMAYLRLVFNTNDTVSFERVINVPKVRWRGVPPLRVSRTCSAKSATRRSSSS